MRQVQQKLLSNVLKYQDHKTNLKDQYRYREFDKDLKFIKYIDKFDYKINKAFQNQKKEIKGINYGLNQQINQVKNQQSRLRQYLNAKQNQFQENYYKFYKQDIQKYKQYNQFFTRSFDQFNQRINQIKLHNQKLKIIIQSLKLKHKFIVQQNKRNRIPTQNSLKQVLTKKLTQATDISLKVKSSLSKQKSRSISLPSIENSNHLTPTNILGKQKASRIKQKRLESLNLLKNLLEFLKNDKKYKKQCNWFEKLLFSDRIFKKISSYLHQKILSLGKTN